MKVLAAITKPTTLRWALAWIIAATVLSVTIFVIIAAPARKDTPPQVPIQRETTPSGFTYLYASSFQHATAAGAYGAYLVGDPTVPAANANSGAHSLAELAVESSDYSQVIEVGWSVAPEQFGDHLPHLFVYHWVDGAPTCYDGCGFISTSTAITPAMPLTPGSTSVFKVVYANSNWNLYDNGTLFGYFPSSLWAGTFTSVAFTQWFGEVAIPATDAPCVQMGTGVFAGEPGSDTITNMGFVNGPPISVVPLVTNPAYYSIANPTPNSMIFGGPGDCPMTAPTPTATPTTTTPSGSSAASAQLPLPRPVTIQFAPRSRALTDVARRTLHTLVQKLAYGASVILIAYAPRVGLAQIRAAAAIHYFTRTILVHVVVRARASSTKNQVTIVTTGQ